MPDMPVFLMLGKLVSIRSRAWPFRLDREGGKALMQRDVIGIAAFTDCDPIATTALEAYDVLPLH
jgi:hypothetical protein